MSWNLFRRSHPTGPIALVTAMFGGIDDLKPLPAHPGIDAFFYTDDAGRSAASSNATGTWTRIIVPDYPRHDLNPRLRARYFKVQIHRLDEVREHRWLVWADSTLRFDDQNLRFGMMDQLSLPVVLAAHGIAPQLLPVNVWKNDYFTWCVHRREM